MKTLGLLPGQVAYMQLHNIFTTPGWLKMHDWIIVTGPILKYLLQDFFFDRQREVLFNYVDCLSRLWCQTIDEASARQLAIDFKAALADMEAFFPAWDLDINRHMMGHVAEDVALSGPPWIISTFPFERFWKRYVHYNLLYVDLQCF